jgi:hypothetical protein
VYAGLNIRLTLRRSTGQSQLFASAAARPESSTGSNQPEDAAPEVCFAAIAVDPGRDFGGSFGAKSRRPVEAENQPP